MEAECGVPQDIFNAAAGLVERSNNWQWLVPLLGVGNGLKLQHRCHHLQQ
jgi:hypothetical protein